MPVPSLIIPQSKIAIVGEAPGKDEVLLGRPFVGSAGQELRSMLKFADINIDSCSLLNVFQERPDGNKIENFCGKKADCGVGYKLPPLRQGKYFLPAHLGQNLVRLRQELETIRPHLVLALGNTASWALLGTAGITTIRGTTAESTLVAGLKVLPTFHPASVLRQWEQRPIVLCDFIKAKREAEFPEVVRPERFIHIDPTLEDCYEFYRQYILPSSLTAVDIETGHGQIKCVGFAPNRTHALVVPFIDLRAKDHSYWPSAHAEKSAWEFVRKVLELPNIKVFQNGCYDMQWLWGKYGLRVGGTIEDTMIAHHALQPELPKSLGFLGSIYTNEASWKLLSKKAGQTDTTKRDE